MAIWQFANFAKATLSGLHTSADTTLNLVSGQGNRFPIAPFYLCVFNSTDYSDPADAFWAGAAELMIVGTNPTANTLPGLTRAADGTTALNFNDAAKTYLCFIPTNNAWLTDVVSSDSVTDNHTAAKQLDITAGGLNVTGGGITCASAFYAPDSGEKTMDSGGAISVTSSDVCIRIDTFADAASDDLDTISGGVDGQLLFCRAENGGRTVVFRHNVDNIVFGDSANHSLGSTFDMITLRFDAALSEWVGQSFIV